MFIYFRTRKLDSNVHMKKNHTRIGKPERIIRQAARADGKILLCWNRVECLTAGRNVNSNSVHYKDEASTRWGDDGHSVMVLKLLTSHRKRKTAGVSVSFPTPKFHWIQDLNIN